MNALFAVSFAIVALTNAEVKLPPSLKPCHRNAPKYTECLGEAAATFMRGIATTGLPAWKIPALEPLSVNSIKIGGADGAVSLTQEYQDVKLYGLTKGLTISNYKADWDKMMLYSESDNPQVDFVAKYKLDGKVLVLPIRGNGVSNITMLNLHSINKMYFEKFEKNGETHLKAKKYEIEFNPEKVILNFDNLFNGDKVLGDQMNKFLNENGILVFNELKKDYENAFGQLFQRITSSVFKNVPLSQLTPP